MMGYGELAIFPLLVWLLLLAVVFWSVAKILRRLGFSPFWSLLILVPLGNVVGLIILAQIRWPRVDREA